MAHRDLPVTEINVLDTQAKKLAQPQPGAVEEACHQPLRSFHVREQRRHLVEGQHHRNIGGAPGALDVVHPRKLLPQHLAIQKQQRSQSLILRGGRHSSLAREVGQERNDLLCAHLGRMTLAAPVDEALDPPHIALFGAITIVPAPQHIAHLVQQSGLA